MLKFIAFICNFKIMTMKNSNTLIPSSDFLILSTRKNRLIKGLLSPEKTFTNICLSIEGVGI